MATTTGNNPVILQVKDISKRYGKHDADVLSQISFFMERGEFVAIMGPSGSGKSTLLNCISTIDTPTSGSIWVGGVQVEKLKGKALAQFRHDQLGFIFQDSNMLDTLTLRENIALPLTIGKMKAHEIQDRVETIAQTLGIKEVLDRFPYEVSGGQKQRAAAARAVIGRPKLILADEPTGSLDSKSSRELLETFSSLIQLGSTLLMVTHDPVAASWCDRIIFIRDGRLWGQMMKDEMDRATFHQAIVSAASRMEQEDVSW